MENLMSTVGQKPRQEERQKTLGEIMALYETFLYRTRPFSTYERYNRALSRFFEAFPLKRSIHDFLRPDIMTYVEMRLADGVSASTLRLELSAIRHFFQFAHDMEFALLNPARGVRLRLKRRATQHNADFVDPLEDSTARRYSLIQGRWVSPDPAGFAAVDITNPQSWNRYTYVLNNPLNAIDPSGLGPCDPGSDEYSPIDCPTFGMPSFLLRPNCYAVATDQGPDLICKDPDGLRTNHRDPVLRSPETNPCSTPTTTTSILSGNATTNIPTIAAGAAVGEVIGGPPGGFIGAIIGSFFGVGGTASYVPSTKSLYAGPTVVFAPALGGGQGISGNVVSVPAGQNPNSIANGKSFSVTFQPTPLLGSTVVKSPGSGPPVVGPSVGTRIPVSFGASYNVRVRSGECHD